MSRIISEDFKNELINGGLNQFLKLVKNDDTLQLEIRNNYINIYYRGGNITKISECNKYIYDLSFNKKYLTHSNQKLVSKIRVNLLNSGSLSVISNWLKQIPQFKHNMDLYFTQHPKEEQDYQQHIVHINNYAGPSNSTDYFICDVEYQNKSKLRIDMVGLEWLSTSHNRMDGNNLRLAFIEMKFMDKALTKKSGIISHLEELYKLLNNNNKKLSSIKEEMINIFNLKKELGLISVKNKIISLSNEKPLYLMIFAEHDPQKSVLIRELKMLVSNSKYRCILNYFDIKLVKASFMGYGLFNQNIYDLEKWIQTYN